MILKIPDNYIQQGSLVALRAKSFDDLYNDYRWRKDVELAKYDATRPLNISFENFVKRFNDEFSVDTNERQIFSIESIMNKKHIGNIMYYSFDTKKKNVEMGITIGERSYWNQGYGTESVLLFLEFLFSFKNIKSVYLHTLEWNDRAKLSFLKSGFQEIKRVRRLGYTFIKMEIQKN